MVGLIYSLCALTALACALLLFRGFRRSRYKLLLWGGICFIGLTINNVMIIVDEFVYPNTDLSTWRMVFALVGLMLFMYGLIWDSE